MDKKIIISILVLLFPLIAFSQKRISHTEPDTVYLEKGEKYYPRKISEYDLKEYIIKNKKDSLAIKLTSVMEMVIDDVSPPSNTYMLSFYKRRRGVYIKIRTLNFWDILNSDDSDGTVYGVYQFKMPGRIVKFVILSDHKQSSLKILNSTFKASGTTICYKQKEIIKKESMPLWKHLYGVTYDGRIIGRYLKRVYYSPW